MSSNDDFKTTLGAVIIGIPLAIMFTGVLVVECILYWRSQKPTDTWRMSCLVLSLLALDLFHSALLLASAWKWFIVDRANYPDLIPITMALTILVSGVSTLISHSVYSWRIFRFSMRNYWITMPIMVLALLRFISACISTSHMIVLRSFDKFRHSNIQWVFSSGLVLTCVVDIMITGTMTIILRRSRDQSISLDGVIDSLILYTLETGSATVITTIAMTITWLAMPENLIFMALHTIIAKLYANSVVAMLNYRQSLRDRAAHAAARSADAVVDLDVVRFGNGRRGRFDIFRASSTSTRNRGILDSAISNVPPVEVNITKTMQMHDDGNLMDEPNSRGNTKGPVDLVIAETPSPSAPNDH